MYRSIVPSCMPLRPPSLNGPMSNAQIIGTHFKHGNAYDLLNASKNSHETSFTFIVYCYINDF